jgi:hypothetical protein
VTSDSDPTLTASANLRTVVASQSAVIQPNQTTTFSSLDNRLTLSFVPGAAERAVQVVYTPLVTPTNIINVAEFGTSGGYFVLQLLDAATNQPVTLQQPVQAEVQYTDAELAAAGIDEDRLAVIFWNGSEWVQVGAAGLAQTDEVIVDPDANTITFSVAEGAEYALANAGQEQAGLLEIYLPIVVR